jgi:hypothetical protein
MLGPTDLGSGWYSVYTPNPSLMSITAQETSEGQVVRVKDFVQQEHWDRVTWLYDGFVLETLLHFDSATQAANHTATWKAQNPSVTLSPQTVGPAVAQEGVTATGLRYAVFVVGDNFFEVTEASDGSVPLTVAQFETAVTAAVARATTSS